MIRVDAAWLAVEPLDTQAGWIRCWRPERPRPARYGERCVSGRMDQPVPISMHGGVGVGASRSRLLIDGLNPRLCGYELMKLGSADRLIVLMGSEQHLELVGGHGPAVQKPLRLLTTERLEEIDLLDAFHAFRNSA